MLVRAWSCSNLAGDDDDDDEAVDVVYDVDDPRVPAMPHFSHRASKYYNAMLRTIFKNHNLKKTKNLTKWRIPQWFYHDHDFFFLSLISLNQNRMILTIVSKRKIDKLMFGDFYV